LGGQFLKTVDVVVGVFLRGTKFLVERRGLDEKIDPGVVCQEVM
jgi:hypothetical protein